LKHHLIPAFGELRLDEIKTHSIEVLKADLLAKGKSRKCVNNILACLGKMLRYEGRSDAVRAWWRRWPSVHASRAECPQRSHRTLGFGAAGGQWRDSDSPKRLK
jgi:hypothetical protein